MIKLAKHVHSRITFHCGFPKVIYRRVYLSKFHRICHKKRVLLIARVSRGRLFGWPWKPDLLTKSGIIIRRPLWLKAIPFSLKGFGWADRAQPSALYFISDLRRVTARNQSLDVTAERITVQALIWGTQWNKRSVRTTQWSRKRLIGQKRTAMTGISNWGLKMKVWARRSWRADKGRT